MTTFARNLLPGLLIWAFGVAAAHADIIHLKTGATLTGTLETLADGSFSLRLPGGEVKKVSKTEVQWVDFAPLEKPKDDPGHFLSSLSKTESPFGTPRLTFERWRSAAIRGDVKGMVECYASFRKDEVRKELRKLPKDAFEKMRSVTAETQFTAAEAFYQGDRATLEINWTKGLFGDSQVIQFILEKNEWKIIQ